MLFIYLYHGDLYSDLRKSDLYFRPAEFSQLLLTMLMTLGLHHRFFFFANPLGPLNSSYT